MTLERPDKGGHVPLDDDSLIGIGLAVVYESAAKSAAGGALRALASLTFEDWKRTEKQPFKLLLKKIKPCVDRLEDGELASRFDDLEQALADGHELRHIIVHVSWGEGGDGFLGYDYSREKEVTSADIQQALNACAEIKRACHWFALRVGELVALGKLPDRGDGPGMSIKTQYGLAKL